MENDLNRWISDYVAPDPGASAADKARFPLREAQIQVAERPGKPGAYQCVMRLLPHYQLDALAASVTLKTEMGSGVSR
jgi:predicted component of type VI protein secretion system